MQTFYDPVTVDGVLTFNTFDPFNNPRPTPAVPVLYFLDLLDGWDDTAEPRVDVSEFGSSDGVVGAARFPKKEQYIVLGGVVVGIDRTSTMQAVDGLSLLLDHDRTMQILRSGPIPRAMDMRRATTFKIVSDLGKAVRWSVTLMAEWPYKYSPTPKTASAAPFSGSDYYRVYDDQVTWSDAYDDQVTYSKSYQSDTALIGALPDFAPINNEGTADAYPVLKVTGPLLARTWALVNETNGDLMTFDLDLSAGTQLVLDSLNKTALIGGQDVSYYVRGDWLRIPRGANTIRLSVAADSPGAQLDVIAYDTWKR